MLRIVTTDRDGVCKQPACGRTFRAGDSIGMKPLYNGAHAPVCKQCAESFRCVEDPNNPKLSETVGPDVGLQTVSGSAAIFSTEQYAELERLSDRWFAPLIKQFSDDVDRLEHDLKQAKQELRQIKAPHMALIHKKDGE